MTSLEKVKKIVPTRVILTLVAPCLFGWPTDARRLWGCDCVCFSECVWWSLWKTRCVKTELSVRRFYFCRNWMFYNEYKRVKGLLMRCGVSAPPEPGGDDPLISRPRATARPPAAQTKSGNFDSFVCQVTTVHTVAICHTYLIHYAAATLNLKNNNFSSFVFTLMPHYLFCVSLFISWKLFPYFLQITRHILQFAVH